MKSSRACVNLVAAHGLFKVSMDGADAWADTFCVPRRSKLINYPSICKCDVNQPTWSCAVNTSVLTLRNCCTTIVNQMLVQHNIQYTSSMCVETVQTLVLLLLYNVSWNHLLTPKYLDIGGESVNIETSLQRSVLSTCCVVAMGQSTMACFDPTVDERTFWCRCIDQFNNVWNDLKQYDCPYKVLDRWAVFWVEPLGYRGLLLTSIVLELKRSSTYNSNVSAAVSVLKPLLSNHNQTSQVRSDTMSRYLACFTVSEWDFLSF